MSSIISDIFYNPKNNNLIDNYLIHRHQYDDSSVSNIIDGGSWQNDGTLNINLQIKVEKENLEKFNRRDLFVMKAQIGKYQNQETSKATDPKTIHINLSLSNIPVRQIYTHSHLRLQFRINNHNTGFSYVPIENIRELLERQQDKQSKKLTLKLRNPLERSESKSKSKYKVQCILHLGRDISNIQYYNNLSRKEKTESGGYQSYFGTTQQNDRSSEILRGDHQKYKKSKNKADKGEKKPKKYNQQISSDISWTNILNQKDHSQASQPKPYKLQQQIKKPIKFSITALTINNNSQQKQSPTNDSYFFVIKSKNDLIEKVTQFDQIIQISNGMYDKQGIFIEIYGLETQVDKKQCFLGISHINAVALLGGTIEGIFPVIKPESQEFVGLITLKQTLINLHQYSPQLIQNQQNSYIEAETIQPTYHQYLSSFILKFHKILILLKKTQQPRQSLELKAIIRINNQTIQCLTDSAFQIKCNTIQQHQLIEIDTQELIKLTNIVNLQSTIIIEIELYAEVQIVGYLQTKVQWEIDEENMLRNMVWRVNMSTQRSICHSLLEVMRINTDPKYLLSNRMNSTLNILGNSSLFDEIKNYQGAVQQIQQKIIQKIMTFSDHPLYIQSSRITQILMSALITNRFHHTSINKSESYISGCSKFLQELLYLDSQSKGYIGKDEIISISDYYGISQEQWRNCLECFDEKQCEQNVLYLFMISGYTINVETLGKEVKQNPSVPMDNKSPQNQEKKRYEQCIQQFQERQTKYLDKQPKYQEKHPRKQQQIHQKYLITGIQCQNMQSLTQKCMIPSIKIQVGDSYFTRTMYRMANPHFNLHLPIIGTQKITIWHRDIKTDTELKIWDFDFIPATNKSSYKYRDAFVKISYVLQ